jgi:hypothetical protein
VISVEGASGNVALCLADGAIAPLSALGQGRLRYNSALSQLEYSQNGSVYVPFSGGGGGGGWTDDGAVVRLTTAADSVSIGNNLMAGSEKLRVTGGGLLIDGAVGAAPVAGAGARLMWTPSKYALRAGEVTGTQWDAANIGDWSTAFGLDVKASGAASFAACRGATATGDVSCALGDGTESEASYSTAMGRLSKARRRGQVSMGNGMFAVPGDIQQSFITMQRVQPIGTTTVDLTIDGLAPAGIVLTTSNRFILEDSRTYTFEVLVQSRNTAASESKSWTLLCEVKRDIGAGTVSLVGVQAKNIVGMTPGLGLWDVNLVADPANGAMVLRFSGDNTKQIRCGAGIRWIEAGT